LRGGYPFNFEIADIFSTQSRYEEMIAEFLGLLEINESYLQSVQNALSRTMSFETNTKQNQVLRTALLKRTQRNPNKKVYAEMLIWLFLQHKDFQSALLQAKALDRRFKEDGGRIISIANLCASNKNYDVAAKAYNYIIAEKEDSPYYLNSKIKLLNVMNKKITTTTTYVIRDLQQLEENYYATIDDLGQTSETVPLLQELAELQAYYLHNIDTAIAVMADALAIAGLKPVDKAECKLLLGDILLINEEIWEASLYYSQVEKAFKYDELGERAKFRNAKIAYYTGDFQWSKAQLDVLKGSTSKLIANDALDLSLLITDNTGIDTTEKPMLMYARSELLIIQNKYREAVLILDSIKSMYPGHSLEDEILYQCYEIESKNKNFDKAKEYLETIITNFPQDILADNALFKLAELHQFHFDELDKAKELYQRLLVEYPGSLFVVEARKT